MSSWEKRTVFLVAGLVFGLLLAVKITSPGTYHQLIQEDGALETIQAAAYFVAALLACRVAATRSGPSSGLIRLAYLALACGLLFVAIEEISWGQRLFDIATPEWFRRHSSQSEINIHNLYPVQRVLHPIYIAVGWWGAVLVGAPLGLAGRSAFVREVATQWYTSAYFLICSLIYIGLELAKSLSDRYGIAVLRPGDVIVWRDQEVGETMLAMGFLMFLATKLLEEARRARSTRPAEAG